MKFLIAASGAIALLAYFFTRTEKGKEIAATTTTILQDNFTIGSEMTFAEKNASNSDVEVMARTIYGEARGEGSAGMIAVANVINNRAKISIFNVIAKARFGFGIKGVCQKKYQFSIWLPMYKDWVAKNGNTASGKQIIAAYNAMINVPASDPVFQNCLTIAKGVIDGSIPDNTGGSTYYHTKSVSPAWSQGIAPVAVVGSHEFYTFDQIA